MKSFKLKIHQDQPKNDLTIIYKEGENQLHEFKTSKDSLLNSLHYFEKKRNEINSMNIIYIEENIPIDIFKEFISSISIKEIEINENNYETFLYLSNKYEYKELQEDIQAFIESRPDINEFLREMSETNQDENESKTVDYFKEEIISKNLDVSISSGLLDKLQIDALIRILNSPKRKIKDHHLLFSFVISILKKFNENQFNSKDIELYSILPSCLDYYLMTSNEISELFTVVGQTEMLSPQNSSKLIQKFISNENEMNKKYSELEKRIAALESKTANIGDSVSSIETMQKSFQSQQNQLKNQQAEIVKHVEDDQRKMMNEQNQIKNMLQNQKEEIESNMKIELTKIKNSNSLIQCPNGIFQYLFDKNDQNPVKMRII